MRLSRNFHVMYSCLLLFSNTAWAIPNPAAVMCAAMGYQAEQDDCVFPDKSRCNQWAFWRGECGQSFHICTQNQGKIVVQHNISLCDINDQLYTWELAKQSQHDSHTTWTVVLKPYTTSAKTSS